MAEPNNVAEPNSIPPAARQRIGLYVRSHAGQLQFYAPSLGAQFVDAGLPVLEAHDFGLWETEMDADDYQRGQT